VEEEGGSSCNPSEDFKKFGHKNLIKHEKVGLLDFISTSRTP
jgi:hypothetical protein